MQQSTRPLPTAAPVTEDDTVLSSRSLHPTRTSTPSECESPSPPAWPEPSCTLRGADDQVATDAAVVVQAGKPVARPAAGPAGVCRGGGRRSPARLHPPAARPSRSCWPTRRPTAGPSPAMLDRLLATVSTCRPSAPSAGRHIVAVRSRLHGVGRSAARSTTRSTRSAIVTSSPKRYSARGAPRGGLPGAPRAGRRRIALRRRSHDR